MDRQLPIRDIFAREILDSRGNPTLEAEVLAGEEIVGRASVPSGASTGRYEALELRDQEERYGGLGVERAVENVNSILAHAVIGKDVFDQEGLDRAMIEADGTKDKSNLGANAILGVSMAAAHAAAEALKVPLYRYLGGVRARQMPVPMMNIINGGVHADNSLDIQEFMIMPVGACCFSEGLRQCSEIYHTLGKLLKEKGLSTAVGDEGGFAPDLENDEQAIEYIIKAINLAGYNTDSVKIALDAAASEWYEDGKYHLPKRNIEYTTENLIDYFKTLIAKYPIISIEDPLSEDDWSGWTKITAELGSKINLVGDDLFVTNTKRLNKGINEKAANSILVKINQIGTLTETMKTITTAHHSGYKTIISHRSGETEDTTIADIAVAVNSGYIKTGAPCRTDRVSKYNRLLRIESMLINNYEYGNNKI